MTKRTRILQTYFAVLAIALVSMPALCQGFGHYEGTVQTEWLRDGRRMRLLAPVSYFDPKGKQWVAPKDWVIDGASIPQPAWSFSGGPFEGKYRDASVIHDVGCDRKTDPWEEVHEVFYYGMLASGVESWRAKIMYAAVYHFGPRWPRVVEVVNRELGPSDRIAAPVDVGISAAPGSTAKVLSKAPRITWPEGRVFSTPRVEQVTAVEIQPPPLSLTDADFEQLKAKIAASAASGDVSLQEIQSFRPTGR